jgi:hypothetical protein
MSLGWLFVTPWFLAAAGPGDLARLTTGGWLSRLPGRVLLRAGLHLLVRRLRSFRPGG